jgi:hypothetical protein
LPGGPEVHRPRVDLCGHLAQQRDSHHRCASPHRARSTRRQRGDQANAERWQAVHTRARARCHHDPARETE